MACKAKLPSETISNKDPLHNVCSSRESAKTNTQSSSGTREKCFNTMQHGNKICIHLITYFMYLLRLDPIPCFASVHSSSFSFPCCPALIVSLCHCLTFYIYIHRGGYATLVVLYNVICNDIISE